jgi:hypothetical protein
MVTLALAGLFATGIALTVVGVVLTLMPATIIGVFLIGSGAVGTLFSRMH